MNFGASISSKTSHISNERPPLPRLPSRVPSKHQSASSKAEMKIHLSSVPNQNDLDVIVNKLSTIVKRSEQLLTPDKPSQITATVRRTSSLHIANRQDLSNSFVKTSNSHHDTLTTSNLDISRLNIQRRSLRNIEKFSGIKCSLPSGTSTIPNTFKCLDKHRTPTKPKQTNISSSFMNNQITPTTTTASGKVKSPWRLRFEKLVNHQELTPLSPANESIAFKTAKTSSSNKENRTPSFRLPTRRISQIHLLSKKDN